MIDKKYLLFDEVATDSRYTDPDAKCPNYNIRAVEKYCVLKGISPNQLSYEELKQFIISSNKRAA